MKKVQSRNAATYTYTYHTVFPKGSVASVRNALGLKPFPVIVRSTRNDGVTMYRAWSN